MDSVVSAPSSDVVQSTGQRRFAVAHHIYITFWWMLASDLDLGMMSPASWSTKSINQPAAPVTTSKQGRTCRVGDKLQPERGVVLKWTYKMGLNLQLRTAGPWERLQGSFSHLAGAQSSKPRTALPSALGTRSLWILLEMGEGLKPHASPDCVA